MLYKAFAAHFHGQLVARICTGPVLQGALPSAVTDRLTLQGTSRQVLHRNGNVQSCLQLSSRLRIGSILHPPIQTTSMYTACRTLPNACAC